jgi:DNA-binding transcriptional ArsR family regulator
MTMDEVVSAPVGVSLQAAPSLACDLSWILSVAARPSWRAKYPMLSEMFAGREEVAERVRDFWGDGYAETCFTEMQILADHAGANGETSAPALWEAIERAVATVPLDLALESETPEQRAMFMQRLARLKESPDLVRRYIGLLREVWEPIDAIWQSALPVLEDAARRLQDQLDRGRPFTELVSVECAAFRDRLPGIRARLGEGHRLLIVPCFFFGRSLYLEFPGLTLIGTGIEEHGRVARARTESVARRLKTVADPTRLALLHFLAFQPSTVGDLAASFGLAQPTVSMHVKLLRETGLVRGERQSGRLQLSADVEAVESLLDDLRGVVTQGASTTGSERMPATVVEATRSAVPVTA